MNIFCLDESPEISAQYHCDKHVVKMIVESAQMLSTAHRVIDSIDESSTLYKIAHRNHPSTKWTMESDANYHWHYRLFAALCNEYTHRYGKIHMTDSKLRDKLGQIPVNIPLAMKRSPFALAMNSNPECMNPLNPIQSYRSFYKTKKDKFKMVWTKRNPPDWFINS